MSMTRRRRFAVGLALTTASMVMATGGAGAETCAAPPDETVFHGRVAERDGDRWTFEVGSAPATDPGREVTVRIEDGRPSPYVRYQVGPLPSSSGLRATMDGPCPTMSRLGLAVPTSASAMVLAHPAVVISHLVVLVAGASAVVALRRARRRNRDRRRANTGMR